MIDFNTLNKMLLLFLLNIYFFSRPETMIHLREYIRIILNNIYDKNVRFIEFIINYNNTDIDSDIKLEEKENTDVNLNNNAVTKYEDKYLQDIRRLNKEFVFEIEEEEERNEIYLATFTELNQNLLEEIKQIKNKIDKNKLSIANFELKKEDYCVFNEDEDEDEDKDVEDKQENNKYDYESDCDSNGDCETKEALIFDNECLEKEYNKFIKLYEDQEGIKKEAYNISRKFIINKQLEKLNNCYVMEKTPLGNVLMIYNIKRETFSYYSDNAIPYRYLETVARKYVKTFNCRPIFVDMEEELKVAEEKEKERKEIEEKEIENKNNNRENGDINQQKKKNVFAKFKSYNKDTSATTKSMAAPPKNSIPNAQLTKEQENEKILLKEKANCYTYEGKFANFSFLKKVDRKIVDKKYALSFADFKKIKKGV